MWELYRKESWVLKNWCFWTVMLEKTLESPLDCKEIKPVNPKRNQSWISIGRTDAEAEAPIFCPPDAKNWLIGKDHHPGKDWRQEEKGQTEVEMVGWHHQLNGYEFERALGRWWWTGRLGMLQSMGLQTVGHNWATEHHTLRLHHPRPSRSESSIEVPPACVLASPAGNPDTLSFVRTAMLQNPRRPHFHHWWELSAYYRDEIYITLSIMHDEARSQKYRPH